MICSLVLLSSYACCDLDLSILPRELVQLCNECNDIKSLGFNINIIVNHNSHIFEYIIVDRVVNYKWLFSLKRILDICDIDKMLTKIKLNTHIGIMRKEVYEIDYCNHIHIYYTSYCGLRYENIWRDVYTE
jgi:hypothetical protein